MLLKNGALTKLILLTPILGGEELIRPKTIELILLAFGPILQKIGVNKTIPVNTLFRELKRAKNKRRFRPDC